MTDRLQLRVIDDEGVIGRTIGEITCDERGEPQYTGSRIARDKLESFATNRRITTAQAFALLYADPWSNGKLVLGPSSPIASTRKSHAYVNHLPGEHDQDDRAGGKGKSAVSKLMSALDARGGGVGGLGFEDRDGVEPNRYIDISTVDDQGYYKLETGWFEEGDDGENQVAQITLHVDEVRALASAMATTMLARESAPDGDDPRSVLLSSLMLAGESGGYHPGDPRSDEPYYETARNFDWSRRDDAWEFEATSDDTDETAFTISDEEFAAMHASLVMTLLEEERIKNEG